MLMALGPANEFSKPALTTAEDVPHDAIWAAAQGYEHFEHSPIDSQAGEIRLLKVKKALFRADIIECDIVTTRLGVGGEEFQTLSYCCGNAVSTLSGDKTYSRYQSLCQYLPPSDHA